MKKIVLFVLINIILTVSITLTIIFYNKCKNDSDIAKYNLENPVLIQYKNFDDLLNVINADAEVYYIYMGKPDCPYCQRYLPIINEIMYSKEIPLLYYNAESVKGTYYDEEGVLHANKEYGDLVNWIIDNSTLDAKENSYVGTKTKDNQELDWLFVPRFFKVQNGKIVDCFKSFKEAENYYNQYLEKNNSSYLTLFEKIVKEKYLEFIE